MQKVNSQGEGEVEVFKCKQCEFVLGTKEDFWIHSKVDIINLDSKTESINCHENLI